MAIDTTNAKPSTRQSMRDERSVLAEARKPGGVDRQQRANAEKSHDEAEDASGEGQQHALGQQLPDDAAAARADRGTNGDLTPSARRAHQQQVRDVGAGDQQHEATAPARTRRVCRTSLTNASWNGVTLKLSLSSRVRGNFRL